MFRRWVLSINLSQCSAPDLECRQASFRWILMSQLPSYSMVHRSLVTLSSNSVVMSDHWNFPTFRNPQQRKLRGLCRGKLLVFRWGIHRMLGDAQTASLPEQSIGGSTQNQSCHRHGEARRTRDAGSCWSMRSYQRKTSIFHSRLTLVRNDEMCSINSLNCSWIF